MKDGDIIEQGTHESLLAKAAFMPDFTTASLKKRKRYKDKNGAGNKPALFCGMTGQLQGFFIRLYLFVNPFQP